jgi:hypothetical protein
MRPRIKVIVERTTEEKILLLSSLYDVSYHIARSHYNKANGALDQAKFFLKMYNFKMEMV